MYLSLWSCQHPMRPMLLVTHFTDEETEPQWSQRDYSGPNIASEGQSQASGPERTMPPHEAPWTSYPWGPIHGISPTVPAFFEVTQQIWIQWPGRTPTTSLSASSLPQILPTNIHPCEVDGVKAAGRRSWCYSLLRPWPLPAF